MNYLYILSVKFVFQSYVSSNGLYSRSPDKKDTGILNQAASLDDHVSIWLGEVVSGCFKSRAKCTFKVLMQIARCSKS